MKSFAVHFILSCIIWNKTKMNLWLICESGLKRKFVRLNIKADFYKLLVFLDDVKPDIHFKVRKSPPQTYAEAKSLARNFEADSNEKLHKTVAPTVAVVPDASLVGSLKHQFSALQTQFNALKRSLAKIESNNFRSRDFRTLFSRSTSSPPSGQATMHKRTSTRSIVCYKCRQKGHIARRCRSRVGYLNSYNSFSHSTQSRDSQFKFQPRPQNSVDSLFYSTRTPFLFRFYFIVYHLMH